MRILIIQEKSAETTGLLFRMFRRVRTGFCGSISDLAYEKGIDESLFRTVLSKLDFSKEQLEKNIEDFSEGQKKRFSLLKVLHACASLCGMNRSIILTLFHVFNSKIC